MRASETQPTLFDFDPGARAAQAARAQEARKTMRAMIDRLAALAEPPWATHIEAYEESRVFHHAMEHVPKPEAQAWAAEYRPLADELFGRWIDANVPPDT